MFHHINRFDWVDNLHDMAGDPEWPHRTSPTPLGLVAAYLWDTKPRT